MVMAVVLRNAVCRKAPQGKLKIFLVHIMTLFRF